MAMGLGNTAAAPPNEFSVRLECQRRPTPGRVLCEAELEVRGGTLAWADVLVLEAPGFAPPLRSRLGPSAVFMKTEQRQRLHMALAATDAGQGRLRVRARAVHCPEPPRGECRAITAEAETNVFVGPITE
jgi:hypothetical protein